ncbi:MAG: Unknown protein [uncultured Campylobacterales bacterium]|uniref:DUF333 domain-containing protein n=1 Tax=uncultured Campylobacterales bacterium TaxID=352960 RepID=A0A6S6SCX3_9BACT|nr:MAG: Unknown protein [uncultured Campylobacterales bacterium]
MKKIVLILAFAFTYVIACGNCGCDSQSFSNNNEKKEKRQPPIEAISICENKEEGSSCEIITRRGENVAGTCQTTPDDKYFACVPKNHKRPQK